MTDQDRGAYTPYNEAPLAFDARSPREGRPVPMTLIASGVVLLAIVGALFLAYRGGVKGGGDAPRAVGAPLGPIKTAAAPEAAKTAGDVDVYAAQNVPADGGAAKPTFAPAPEAPAPRPAPRQLSVQAASPPPVRIDTGEAASSPAPASVTAARTAIRPGAADAPSAAVAATPRRETQPAPKPAAALAAAPAPALKAAAPVAKPAAATAAAGPPAGGAWVQIGAYSSEALATKGYADVSGMMSGQMSGKGRHVEPVEKDGKTMYRTAVTGFSDHAAAKAFCAALSAKGHACFVKG